MKRMHNIIDAIIVAGGITLAVTTTGWWPAIVMLISTASLVSLMGRNTDWLDTAFTPKD